MKYKKIFYKVIAGCQSMRNKANSLIKSINGNIKFNVMKIMSWNKNDGPLKDKISDIKELIKRHSPHIFVVQELNYSRNMCAGIANINGYQFETYDLIKNSDKARCGMWISNKLIYQRNIKLEAKNEAVVAI